MLDSPPQQIDKRTTFKLKKEKVKVIKIMWDLVGMKC